MHLGTYTHTQNRCNMEEIVLKGPHSDMDVRIVNSYPSKVTGLHRHTKERGQGS